MPDPSVSEATNAFYDSSVDYRAGSPHLSHPGLRDRLLRVLHAELARVATPGRPLRVLEVGAGHGGYTEPVLAAGHEVVAVEMSAASLAELTRRFGSNDRFTGVHDLDGSLAGVTGDFDVVLAVSVLHHVPDYLGYLGELTRLLRPGGSLLSLQDPLYYPRRPGTHRLDRGLYLLWRLGRGDLRRGFGTVGRRLRGVYDDADPSDLVEYHAVREGLDELAVQEVLAKDYGNVELLEYWSNQLSVGQALGERASWVNTFGVCARDRR